MNKSRRRSNSGGDKHTINASSPLRPYGTSTKHSSLSRSSSSRPSSPVAVPAEEADSASLLAMRVIVDRSSFDSEDRVNKISRAPSGRDLEKANNTGGGTGPGATEGGGAGTPGSSSGTRKLRRRRMNWKPRLPTPSSKSANSDKLTFLAAADDVSAAYYGGGPSGTGSVTSSSTNRTPVLSNQRRGFLIGGGARSKPKRGTAAAAHGGGTSDDSTIATLGTGVASRVTNQASDRRSAAVISWNDVVVDTTIKEDAPTSSSAALGPGFSIYGDSNKGGGTRSFSTSSSSLRGRSFPQNPRDFSSHSLDVDGGRSPLPLTPTKQGSKSGSTTVRTNFSPAASARTASTVSTSLDESASSGLDVSGFGAGATANNTSNTSDSRSLGVNNDNRGANRLGNLAAASGLVVQPEDYLLAGMRSLSTRVESAGVVNSDRNNDGSSPLRLDSGDELVQYHDDNITSGESSISMELAKLQAQSEGISPIRKSRTNSFITRKKAAASSPSSSDARSRSRSASKKSAPVDVDSAQFIDAERHLRAIHEMGAEHLIHGEYDEAVEVFEEILRGQIQRNGPGHPRVGTALHNLGIVHLKKGDYASAARVCGQAVEVRKGALGPKHLDVAVSLAQLGIAHLESGEHKSALIAFREALHIRRKLLGPKHPKIAKILNNVGCSLFELDEMRGAMLAFEETLDIQRTMMKNPNITGDDGGPGSAEQLLLSIAATLCNIGSINLRLGDSDKSIVALEEALLIQQSVLGDSHQIVLGTVDTIEFIESKYGGGEGFAVDHSSIGAAEGCSMPPMLTRTMNANAIRSVSSSGKTFLQKMEEATFEQFACGFHGGPDIDTAMSF